MKYKDRNFRRMGYYRPQAQKFVESERVKRRHYGLILVAIVLLGMATMLTVSKLTKTPDVKAQSSKSEPKKLQAIDEPLLKASVEKIIADNPNLDIGVSAVDIKTGQSYTYGVENPFIAASVGKLLSATLFLSQVETGKHNLSENINGISARLQIQKMIAESDNDAWNAINTKLGHQALQTYASSHGLASYNADVNTATPSEVASLLNQLYTGKLLTKANSDFLLSNMAQDKEQIQFIRTYIAPATKVYHKAGWLADRAHDTAIVENGDRPYVLVIFTKSRFGNYDFEKGQTIFSGLTKATDAVFTAVR